MSSVRLDESVYSYLKSLLIPNILFEKNEIVSNIEIKDNIESRILVFKHNAVYSAFYHAFELENFIPSNQEAISKDEFGHYFIQLNKLKLQDWLDDFSVRQSAQVKKRM